MDLGKVETHIYFIKDDKAVARATALFYSLRKYMRFQSRIELEAIYEEL